MNYQCWTKKEINILTKYSNKTNKELMGLLSHRTINSISIKRRKLKISYDPRRWTIDEVNILKNNREKTSRKICKIISHHSFRSIQNKRFKNKLTLGYKRNICKDYFKKWSNNMAYVLGFIAADGCIASNGRKSNQYVIHMGIHKKDIKLLKDIKNELGKTLSIYIRNKDNTCNLKFGCKSMVQDLIKLGITPRKSLTLKFPKVPKKYLSHFIRGYFDGDGCIMIRKKNNVIRVHFVGSIYFISKTRKIMEKILNKKITYYINKDKRSNHKKLASCESSGKNTIKFLNWMYKDANLKLDRKYQIYQKAKKIKYPGICKLTKQQVLKIRNLYKNNKYTLYGLTKMFNISRGALSAIIKRTTWKYI